MGSLRFMMCVLVFSIVNQLHLPEFGVKGLNIQNILAFLILVQVLRVGSDSPRPTPFKTGVVMLIAALTYGFVVGVARDSTEWVNDLTAIKNGVFYPLMFLLFYHGIRDLRTAEVVLAAILATAALAGVEAIREGLDYGIEMYSDTKRASGPFGSDYRASNLAAVYFCIFFPMFVSIGFFATTRPMVRLLALGGAALIVLGTFVTYSRQAYAILTLVVMLLAARRNLLLLIPALLALVAYDLWVPDTVVERIAMTEQGDDFTQRKLDDSTESRFELWEAAWRMFSDHPLGVGLGHFKRMIGQYAPTYAGMDAHNFYVLFLAETGVVGVSLLAATVLSLAWLAWHIGKLATTAESRAVAIGFQLSVVAALAGNLYGSRMLDGAVTGTFWILAAAALRFVMLTEQRAADCALVTTVPVVAGRAMQGAGARVSEHHAPGSTRMR